MDFKEKRALQKAISEKLTNLQTSELSFADKRALQKEITADFVKIGEDIGKVDNIPDGVSPLIGTEFGPEGMKKITLEPSFPPEMEPKLPNVKSTVEGNTRTYTSNDGLTATAQSTARGVMITTFSKGGDVMNEKTFSTDREADLMLENHLAVDIDDLPTPTYDKLKAGDFLDLPSKEFVDKLKEAAKELGVEDSLTMDIVGPAESWKNKKEEVANEGVDQEEIDYVDQFLNGESLESDPDPALENASESAQPDEKIEVELIIDDSEPATESTDQDFDDFELDEETENQLVEEIKGDYQLDPELEKEEIATEKVEHIKKLWDYAKKIVLRARFDKEPSGDKKKDEEVITGGKAWGFVQDRYQKLKSGEIKARKPATESAISEQELKDRTEKDYQDNKLEGETKEQYVDRKVADSKKEQETATESVDEIEDDDEIIIG